jgi:hypothetical protein
MIRKSILALAAIATIGAGALATSSAASAKPLGFKNWPHFHHHHFGHRHWGVRFVDVGPDCYWVKRINKFGVVRLVKVCSY